MTSAAVAAALLFGACSTTSDVPETAENSSSSDTLNPTDPLTSATTGVVEDTRVPAVRVDSRDDLDFVDPTPVAVYEVTADATDENVLMARFRAPSPDCFVVQGEAVETDPEEILVRIVGAMLGDEAQCADQDGTGTSELAGLVDQELALTLTGPIEGRSINTNLDSFDDLPPETALDPGPVAPFSEYVSLPLAEAEALAAANGVTYRITRQDSEEFAVTADYDEERANFEVDDGTVSLAFPG